MSLEPRPDDPFALVRARVHEAEGLGRRSFAMFQAALHSGPLIWILPAHARHLPMLGGLPDGVGQRLHLVCPDNETDLLWSAEECLRSPAVGLVIAEPEKPMSLTAGRRLQLAAKAGRTTGLMLTREGHGNNATETRWHCRPVADGKRDSTAHHWELKKNKRGILGFWTVYWNGETTVVHLVSAAGERHSIAETPP